MKKIILSFLIVMFTASCSNYEETKSAKISAASNRINETESNSDLNLKSLD